MIIISISLVLCLSYSLPCTLDIVYKRIVEAEVNNISPRKLLNPTSVRMVRIPSSAEHQVSISKTSEVSLFVSVFLNHERFLSVS